MILNLRHISKTFELEHGFLGSRREQVRAVDDVSFQLEEYSTLGIVGESGSGKSTLARMMLDLLPADSGEIIYNRDLIADFRKDVQIIFQNPFASLDPKMTVLESIAEPLRIHRIVSRPAIRDRAAGLLETVGLSADMLGRYPRQFSGGQRQRICIARALAAEPKLLVLDEPLSSLDLTVQEKLLELFAALKQRYNLTYCFISHNLAVVRYLADNVLVMRQGRVVEQGTVAQVFSRPASSYTRQLLGKKIVDTPA